MTPQQPRRVITNPNRRPNSPRPILVYTPRRIGGQWASVVIGRLWRDGSLVSTER